jgi:hopanoid biosynthesis associated protein HpnK
LRVIFNADDFGATTEINQAVLLAHQKGVLTSASLMVNGLACHEAIEIAQKTPTLAVGLHLVLVNGRSSLGPETLPHLVDRSGNFSSDALGAGIAYFFSPATRRELTQEIAAQFEKFAATGLPLDHVNGHLHMHVHPAIFPIVLLQAVDHQAAGLRLPRDELIRSLAYRRGAFVNKLLWAVEFGLLNRWALARLEGLPLAVTQRVFGLMESGQMSEAYVSQVLERLPGASAEIYFHPSLNRRTERLGPNRQDFETLTAVGLRQAIVRLNLQLCSYSTL